MVFFNILSLIFSELTEQTDCWELPKTTGFQGAPSKGPGYEVGVDHTGVIIYTNYKLPSVALASMDEHRKFDENYPQLCYTNYSYQHDS